MKFINTGIFLLFCLTCHAQTLHQPTNVFIVTTDGFRWEEIFKGADSSLVSNTNYVKDTTLTKQMFWDSTAELRRQKLMPFLWSVIASHGQIYGNRLLNNKVNVKNFYKISYPGYNEILTGFADPLPILNKPVQNRNTNVLEYLNKLPDFSGRVVAFSSWNIMPFIINEKRSNLSVNSGYEMLDGHDELSNMIDSVENNAPRSGTRNDMLTYLSARQYVEQNHPKIMFLSLGETDEDAHHGRYDMYLQKAAAVDRMIADLWYYIQTDPFYKDNTSLIFTTDHGRGKSGGAWRAHGFWIKGSGEAWLAMLGPAILPAGEMKEEQQIWQKQIASTIALLAGEHFTAKHSIGKPINHPAQNIPDDKYITKNK